MARAQGAEDREVIGGFSETLDGRGDGCRHRRTCGYSATPLPRHPGIEPETNWNQTKVSRGSGESA